jgi:hypothetical protein
MVFGGFEGGKINGFAGSANFAQEAHGVGFERKFDGLIIVYNMLGERHFGKGDGGFCALIPLVSKSKQWQRFCFGEGFHLPKGGPAIKTKGAEAISLCQFFKRGDGEALTVESSN